VATALSLPERAPDLSRGTYAHAHTGRKAAHSLLMILARIAHRDHAHHGISFHHGEVPELAGEHRI
jgi:hypothetical protein